MLKLIWAEGMLKFLSVHGTTSSCNGSSAFLWTWKKCFGSLKGPGYRSCKICATLASTGLWRLRHSVTCTINNPVYKLNTCVWESAYFMHVFIYCWTWYVSAWPQRNSRSPYRSSLKQKACVNGLASNFLCCKIFSLAPFSSDRF